MSTQTAADLRQAAVILQVDGWTQGNYHCGGKHCASGALAIATDQHRPMTEGLLEQGGWGALDNNWASYELCSPEGRRRLDAERVLELRLGMSLPHWNDASGRTASDVVALLLSAAADLEDQK